MLSSYRSWVSVGLGFAPLTIRGAGAFNYSQIYRVGGARLPQATVIALLAADAWTITK
jgi:hypothetical protein